MKSLLFASTFCKLYRKELITFNRQKVDYHRILNEKTLTGRMMIYLNQNQLNTSDKLRLEKLNLNTQETLVHNEQISHNLTTRDLIKHFNMQEFCNNLTNLTTSQIRNVFLTIPHQNKIEEKWEYRNVLKSLDAECCSRLNQLDYPEIFNLLHLYMKITPKRILEYKFYENSLRIVYNNLDYLTTNETLQYMFYLALQKKKNDNKKTQNLFKNAFKKIKNEHLNLEETCIVCNSAFKIGFKIKNKLFLEHVISTINNNLHILNDPGYFITLIKTLRHSHFEDDDILNTIKCTILFNRTINRYDFVAICHILALYADYLHYDDDLLKLLYDNGLDYLNNDKVTKNNKDHPTERIRSKDLKRFLWSSANLGYEFNSKDLNDVIVSNLTKRIDVGDYDNDIDVLIDSLFYLWIMNCKPFELIRYAVNEDSFKYVQGLSTKTKQRLNVFLSFIHLENPEFYHELNVHPKYYVNRNEQSQIKKRPGLKRVYRILQLLGERFELKFKYSQEIPYLNILGITGYVKNVYKTVFIEVLDEFVCIRNKEMMIFGPMQAKLRVLEKMDEALIIIPIEEIDEMTDKELESYLNEELSLVI